MEKFLLVVFVLMLGMVHAASAADEPSPVMGIDLKAYPHASHPKDLPDLYEVDPNDKQGRYRERSSVYVMPLGESWLRYPVDKKCFYIEPRETGKDFAGRTYGPIPGDPFEKLDLIKRMTERLVEQGHPDELYRIRLMLRTRDTVMIERAATLLTAALADRGEVYELASNLPAIEEIVKDNQELFKTFNMEERHRQLADRIAAIHVLIDSLTHEYADGDYAKADSSRYAVPKEIPDSAWGKTVKGLRAAVVAPKASAKVGEQLDIFIVVENTLDKPVRFSYSDLTQDARVEIERAAKGQEPADAEAAKVRTQATWFSGISPIERMRLMPGERVVLVVPSVRFFKQSADAKDKATFGCVNAIAGAGEYDAHYTIILGLGSAWSRDADGVMRRTSPGKGEWTGVLTTGKGRLEIGE